MNFYFKNGAGAWFALLVLVLCLTGAAHAASPLDAWRNEVAATRIMAENDAPRAYQDAQRLQATLPGDATPDDKARVINLLARIELYLGLIGQSAQHSADARHISKQNNDHVGQIEADLVIASSAINQGRLDDMVEATRDGMDLLVGVEREDLRAEVMFHAAMMYNRFGQIDESVTVAMQSLDIAKSSNNPLALAHAEHGIAVSFEQTGLYARAAEHFQRMLEAARQAHSTLLEAGALLGLSEVAVQRGSASESERLCKEAIALFRRTGGPLFVGHAVHLLADQYRRNKQPAKALPLVDENVALYEQHENPIGLWWTLNMRSTLLQELGRLDAARGDAERGNELAKKIGFTVYLAGSARRLADVAAAQGAFQQAYRFSAQATELNTRLERENSSKRILELAQRFQQESKQRQIDELTQRNRMQTEQQRWLWTLLGGGVVILMGTVSFMLRLRFKKNQIRALNIGLEQRVLERTAELHKSRQSLAEAQRIAHVGSWEYDAANDTHTWSDELFRIFEIDPLQEGASYQGCVNATHPDDRDAIARAYLDAVETGKTYESEHRLLMADGRIKQVHERGEMVLGSDGTMLRAVGMMQDITERKRMEEALAARERELRALADSSPGMVGSFRLKPDGSVCMPYVSPNIFELFGLHPEDVAENALPLLRLNHPDDAGRVSESIAESARTMTPWHCEFRILHPSKGERWMEGNTNPQSYPDGGVIWYGFVHDITERKRMEAELRASRSFLDSVIDSVADPIFVKDRQHRWVLLNDAFCEFIGHSREVLIGKSDYDFFPEEQAAVFWEKDEIVFESGESNFNEENFTSANGKVHCIQTKKTPFASADGQQMLVGVIRDITELKRYESAREAALAEAQRLANLRREFIAHMSHELRTPLNGILGYAQMLGRDGKLDEKQQTGMDVIYQSGEHLLALIDDILDLARIESGKLELDTSDIPLARFLNIVAGIIVVKARQKRIEFACEFAPDLPEGIRGDEKRLRQVLLNLLSNAVKFTDKGKVTLSVSRVTPSRLAFTVRDTGIGIEQTDRETIFQSFEQVSDTQHRLGGTGLGLSISRQLVRLMGGDIVVESRVGYGSTFRFELELSEVEIGRAVIVEEPRAEPGGEDVFTDPLNTPPEVEMRELHRLALLGNMRDILNHATRIDSLDPRYRPFAEHLKRLANGYRSKAILAFVEEHLT